jgi:hypothetical protein
MTLLRGGNVNLILAPGMMLDGNELSVRHGTLAISRTRAATRLAAPRHGIAATFELDATTAPGRA